MKAGTQALVIIVGVVVAAAIVGLTFFSDKIFTSQPPRETPSGSINIRGQQQQQEPQVQKREWSLKEVIDDLLGRS